jgi:hypothetical protein
MYFFDGARDMWMWNDETPGGKSSEGQVRGFQSFSEVVFPGGKPSTELAFKLLKSCLTFAKEGVGYMAWKWICIRLKSWMVVLMVLVQK